MASNFSAAPILALCVPSYVYQVVYKERTDYGLVFVYVSIHVLKALRHKRRY